MFEELRSDVLKRHQEINALMIVSVNFRLCRKTQGKFDVVISVAPVTAIRGYLITPEFFSAADGLLLQRYADALISGLLAHGKSVDLGFGQLDVVKVQRGTFCFGTNGLNREPDKADDLTRLKCNQQI